MIFVKAAINALIAFVVVALFEYAALSVLLFRRLEGYDMVSMKDKIIAAIAGACMGLIFGILVMGVL